MFVLFQKEAADKDGRAHPLELIPWMARQSFALPQTMAQCFGNLLHLLTVGIGPNPLFAAMQQDACN